MQIHLREDSVELEGYVNAVERDSKTLSDRLGNFIERVCAGAFKKALKRGNNVHILLNHDWDRDLGSLEDGNLELEEDNIGLRVRATITDREVIEKARNGELVGWSFGFEDREVENGLERGMFLRLIKDLFLHEVSVLDRRKKPAYAGTQVYARSIDGEDHIIFRGADNIDEAEQASDVNEKDEKVNIEKEDVNETRDDNTETAQDENVQKTVENSDTQDKELVDNHVDNHEQNIEKLDKIDYSKYEQMIKSIKEDASC